MAFWTGQKVVVTGGAGLVGSYLVSFLLDAGADVLILDNLSNAKHTTINLDKGARILRIDAGNASALETPFKDAFAVFNLAAYVAGVLYNQTHHLEMYHQNERLQTAPVIAAEKAGVAHFLQVSSVCVYAPEYTVAAVEGNGQRGEPVQANNGYSWSKRMGERVIRWSTIPHAVVVRPSNIYGPRDDFSERSHVIPALIKKSIHNDVIHVHGTGCEVREFLYVEDAARGMLAALEKGHNKQAYNLSGAEVISIQDLAYKIRDLCGEQKEVIFKGGNAGDSIRYSMGDKAKREIGFSATTQLDEGLQKTIEWYRSTHANNYINQ